MLATFALTDSTLLIVTLTALVGVAAASHARRGVLVGVVAGGLALGAGTVLKAIGTPAAGAILLGLCAVAAAILTIKSYRAGASKLGGWPRAACVVARTVAWLVVLILIGRPCWDSLTVEWRRPLLVVLLDQSKSMSIVDDEDSDRRTRAAIADAAIRDAGAQIAALDRLYEVSVLGVGDDSASNGDWRITPLAPITPLADALRRAAQSRSAYGEPPVGVLLISDGAENAAGVRVVRAAAAELAARQTPLLALGVGPGARKAPAVMLDPLSVPARIGSRDRLRVPVSASVEGCAGHAVTLEVLWGDERVDVDQAKISKDRQRVAAEFEIRPPGVGLHRLAARVTLPEDLGGESFETSTMIEVSDDRIRVLMVEGRPRNEAAFALRALRGDARFDVTQHIALRKNSRESDPDVAPRWADYDVVILGRAPAELFTLSAIRDLTDAVRERGVGLLMAGGRELFDSRRYASSDLPDISPVRFRRSESKGLDRPTFTPTAAGLRHPVLRGAAADESNAQTPGADVWSRLPPLGAAAELGAPRELATVLATDGHGRPLLVAQDVGRGRTIAAAWESSWPWVLESNVGAAAHGRLWRQMTAWLANRRPAAWVVADRSSYVRDALKMGRQALRIRAGLSGADTSSTGGGAAEFAASLTLRLVAPDQPPPPESDQAPAEWTIPLRRQGAEWRAELPRDLAGQSWLVGGEYELEFAVTRQDATPQSKTQADSARRPLIARGGFRVVTTDLELTEPTSNLALLREAAARTQSVGGSCQPVDKLADVLRSLLKNDRRRRIEHRTRFDVAARLPWGLLAALTAALVAEWIVRKRGGLA